MSDTITVRRADLSDGSALRDLAELDSALPLAAPILMAEVGGHPRAALSLADGSAVGDPFHPTADLVELLRVHAAQLAPNRRSTRMRLAARAPSPRASLAGLRSRLDLLRAS